MKYSVTAKTRRGKVKYLIRDANYNSANEIYNLAKKMKIYKEVKLQ